MREPGKKTDLFYWLAHNGLSQRAFAERVGAHYTIISRVVGGKMTPTLELAVRIERETNGEVPASSWVPEVPETQKGAA